MTARNGRKKTRIRGAGGPRAGQRKHVTRGLLEKLVALADEIVDRDSEAICLFARSVLEDDGATNRDKARAAQLLERFIQHGMHGTIHRENMAAKAQGLDQVQINVVYQEPENAEEGPTTTQAKQGATR